MCSATSLALATTCLPLAGAEPDCESHSTARRVAVIELYTSEGCNSCPPADRWVSSLPALGFSADRVVPPAFHVDYWDYLGWRDRFAQASFCARQRAQADHAGARFVYTPQLLLNGADFRQPLLDSGFPERLARVNGRAVALHGHWKRPDFGIAAFVQDIRDGDVLQALHAPLCGKP